jgi:hypothetical protein
MRSLIFLTFSKSNYLYKQFRKDIDFKKVFEDVTSNENEEEEILQTLASSIHHLFIIAD